MQAKVFNTIKGKPLFLILLPIFFIQHGLIDYNSPLVTKTAFELIVIYGVAALLLVAIAWVYLRDITKASFFALALITFNFFFGSTYDFLKSSFLGKTFLLKYSFILPAAFIFFCTWLLFLKKTKRSFRRTTFFLNLLLILLIVADALLLVPKMARKNALKPSDLSKEFITSDTSPKPDVYLIIADEYAGKTELEEVFGCDNSSFENELKRRGFHIIEATVSNYNATVYSMSSLFSMNYLNLKKTKINHRDMLLGREIINRNNLLYFFKAIGYTTYNYSPFLFNDKKNPVVNPFFPTAWSLLTSTTFINKVKWSLGFNFASRQQIERLKKHHYFNNKTIDSLAKANAINAPGPKFVYTHISAPHHPYYFDRNGKETPVDSLTDGFTMNKEAYIDYLLYSNKKLLELIDHIKSASPTPPVIILMSDHGFRQLPPDTDHAYQFMNLNAVSLPDSNYAGFYKGMSNVNEFRVILNCQFGQRLSLLSDSTIYLSE